MHHVHMQVVQQAPAAALALHPPPQALASTNIRVL
jgi:hypothetical protein